MVLARTIENGPTGMRDAQFVGRYYFLSNVSKRTFFGLDAVNNWIVQYAVVALSVGLALSVIQVDCAVSGLFV